MKTTLKMIMGVVLVLSLTFFSGSITNAGKASAAGEITPAPTIWKDLLKNAPPVDDGQKILSAKTAASTLTIYSDTTLTTHTYSQNVTIAQSVFVDIPAGANVVINGDFEVEGALNVEGSLTVNGNIAVYDGGMYKTIAVKGSGKIVINKVPSKGVVGTSKGGMFTVSQNAFLIITDNASVTVNKGDENSGFYNFGRLVMNSANAKLTVNALFAADGGDSRADLSAGSLVVNGDFMQEDDISKYSFSPGPNFQVTIAGTSAQERLIMFYTPGYSYLYNYTFSGVVLDPSSAVSLYKDMDVSETIDMGDAAVAITGKMNGYNMTVTAGAVYAGLNTSLTPGGGKLTVNGILALDPTADLVLGSTNDKVIVNGAFLTACHHTADMSHGLLEINGDFVQYPDTDASFLATFTPGAALTTRIKGDGRIVYFNNPENSYITKFDLAASLDSQSIVSVNYKFDFQPTWNIPLLYLSGDLNGWLVDIQGDVVVPQSSVLNANGILNVSKNLSVYGSMTMTDSNAKVTVNGDFVADGASSDGNLTNGKLYLKGNFTQNHSVSTSSFRATGSHTTYMVGSGAQTITFNTNTGTSRFATLCVENDNIPKTSIPTYYDKLIITGTKLGGITSDAGKLYPDFDPDHTQYLLILPKGTDHVTVTPQKSDRYTDSSMIINSDPKLTDVYVHDIPAASFSPVSIQIKTVGDNTMNNGNYFIEVMVVDTNLGLLNLPSKSSSDPALSPDVHSYTVQLPETCGGTTWSPYAENSASTVVFNDNNCLVDVEPGNSVTKTLHVIGQDHVTIGDDYTFSFTRRDPISNITVSNTSYVFNPDVEFNYIYVPSTVTSVTVMPTINTADCSQLKIKGSVVSDLDNTSQTIDLPIGITPVEIKAVDKDGKTTSTYELYIDRVQMLNGINVSAGSLSPVFSPETASYAVYLDAATSSVTVAPVVSAGCYAKIDGVRVSSKDYSVPIGGTVRCTISCTGSGDAAQTFTVDIYRIAPITGIKLSTGTLSPAFSMGQTSYTVSVPAATDSVTLTPQTSASYQAAAGDAVAPVTLTPAVGETKTAVFKATAVNGTPFTYNVNVSRAVMVTDIKLSAGYLDTPFSPTKTAYAVRVGATVASVTVTPVKAKTGVKYFKINGKNSTNVKLSPAVGGSKQAEIQVYGTDGKLKATYTVTVNRDALVSSISVSAGTLSPAFSATTSSYSVSVPADTNEVDVTATQAAGALSITNGYTALKPFPGGSVSVAITATATDKKTKSTYTVTASRAPIIDSISATGGTLSPAFNTGILNYTVSLPATASGAVAVSTVKDAVCTQLTIAGEETASKNFNPKIGESIPVQIVGCTAGGATVTYTVTISRAALVTGISSGTKGVSLSPSFDPKLISYTINTSAGSVVIKASKASKGVKSMTINGKKVTSFTAKPAVGGTAIVTVVAVATDNVTTSTYTILIKRSAPLLSLAADTAVLTPAFSADTKTYDVNLPASVSSVTLTPTPNTLCTCTNDVTGISGPVTVSVNPSRTKTIKFTADSADKSNKVEYTVNVHRATLLASVDVNGTALTIQNNALSYNADADAEVTSVTVTPTVAEGFQADHPSYTLTPALGGTATATIVVSAASDPSVAVQTYTVTVHRGWPLAGIDVSAASQTLSLDPSFQGSTLAYEVNVGADIDTVTVMPAAASGCSTDQPTYILKPGIGGSDTATIDAFCGSEHMAYTVTVNRDPALSGIDVTNGTLVETFDAGLLIYHVNAKIGDTVTLTPSLFAGSDITVAFPDITDDPHPTCEILPSPEGETGGYVATISLMSNTNHLWIPYQIIVTWQ